MLTYHSSRSQLIKSPVRSHRGRYGSAGEAQAAVANRCCVALWEATFGASVDGINTAPMFLFCPTEYCGRIAQVCVCVCVCVCVSVCVCRTVPFSCSFPHRKAGTLALHSPRAASRGLTPVAQPIYGTWGASYCQSLTCAGESGRPPPSPRPLSVCLCLCMCVTVRDCVCVTVCVGRATKSSRRPSALPTFARSQRPALTAEWCCGITSMPTTTIRGGGSTSDRN